MEAKSWSLGTFHRPTHWSFSCSENVKLEGTYLLLGKNLIFVLDMWN